jgi:hypothetical protein
MCTSSPTSSPGATYSDFQHYSLELQAAYKYALAEQAVKFAK